MQTAVVIMVKKIIIMIELIILFSLLALSNNPSVIEAGVNSNEIDEQEKNMGVEDIYISEEKTETEDRYISKKYYYMTATAYSNDSRCIAKKWRDGKTAMGTPIREGVCAINVDLINGEWQVRSPLKLGQKIYIEGMGRFSIEDTGYFTEKDLNFDFWNIDVYKKDYEQARKWGIKRVKVEVLE